nr:MAG TPA: hypothetical protein [Caudoviricetes sp.]
MLILQELVRKGLKNKVMSLICQHKLTNGGTANEKG